DDLLVFLLDLVGRIPNRQWLPFAICFLRAYNDAAVMRELKKRLVIPTGLALIWWNVRTNFTGTAKVNRRFQALRRAIGKLELHRSLAIDSARKKRRPSINCQRTRPGMPTIKSRKRASKDMAKAVSPGMPRRLPTTSIKVAHGLVERFSALHEGAPFRRLNETCNDDTDEAKHSQALRNVEPSYRNDRDNGSDQSWTDKTGSTGSLDKQHQSQQREH